MAELTPADRAGLAFLEAVLATAGPDTVLVICAENWAIRPRFCAHFVRAEVANKPPAFDSIAEAVNDALVRLAR